MFSNKLYHVVLALVLFVTLTFSYDQIDRRNTDLHHVIQPFIEQIKNVRGAHVPITDLEVNQSIAGLPASLIATRGTLRDVSTLNVSRLFAPVVDPTTINIQTSLTFGRLVLTYRHYTFNVGLSRMLGWSGDSLVIHIKQNAIEANVSVEMKDSRCNLTDVRIHLRQWQDMELDIKGFGPFNRLVSRLMEPFADIFNNMFRTVAQQFIVRDIKKKSEMCNHFVKSFRKLFQEDDDGFILR